MSLSRDLADLRDSYQAVKNEQAERQKIIDSPEYQALQSQMDTMLAHIPNTTEEYEADLKAVVDRMNAEGIAAEGFAVKTRAIRSVDVPGVLRAMGGDIDNLMLVTSVTQKSLDKFIKDNPGYKADLRACIKDEGTKVVDVIPSN